MRFVYVCFVTAAMCLSSATVGETIKNYHVLSSPGGIEAAESNRDALDLIHARAAHALPGGQGEGQTVCLVDSGVDMSLPWLKSAVVDGINLVANEPQFAIGDTIDHGTGLAGLILSVAPKAKLFIVRVIGDLGTTDNFTLARAIELCSERAQIISLSVGGGEDSVVVGQAIAAAVAHGVTVVAAAGNGSGQVAFPARLPQVIAVGSANLWSQRSAWSTVGFELDVLSPGEGVEVVTTGGGFERRQGTSYSSAIVAGVEAIRRSRGKTSLQARDLGLSRELQGQGLIDALLTAAN